MEEACSQMDAWTEMDHIFSSHDIAGCINAAYFLVWLVSSCSTRPCKVVGDGLLKDKHYSIPSTSVVESFLLPCWGFQLHPFNH